MSIELNITKGCVNCGAADHTVTVEDCECDGKTKLDIVLTCDECGHRLNGFMALDDMMKLDEE